MNKSSPRVRKSSSKVLQDKDDGRGDVPPQQHRGSSLRTSGALAGGGGNNGGGDRDRTGVKSPGGLSPKYATFAAGEGSPAAAAVATAGDRNSGNSGTGDPLSKKNSTATAPPVARRNTTVTGRFGVGSAVPTERKRERGRRTGAGDGDARKKSAKEEGELMRKSAKRAVAGTRDEAALAAAAAAAREDSTLRKRRGTDKTAGAKREGSSRTPRATERTARSLSRRRSRSTSMNNRRSQSKKRGDEKRRKRREEKEKDEKRKSSKLAGAAAGGAAGALGPEDGADAAPGDEDPGAATGDGDGVHETVVRLSGDYDYKADGETMALTRHNIARFTQAPKNELKHIDGKQNDQDFKQARALERKGIQKRINSTMELFYSRLAEAPQEGVSPKKSDRRTTKKSGT